jgi:hypothetical protein
MNDELERTWKESILAYLNILQFSRGDRGKLPVRTQLDTWILRISRRNINYPTVTFGKAQKKFSCSGIKLMSRVFSNYRNGVCKIKELRNNYSLYTWAAKCWIKGGVPNFQTENMEICCVVRTIARFTGL